MKKAKLKINYTNTVLNEFFPKGYTLTLQGDYYRNNLDYKLAPIFVENNPDIFEIIEENTQKEFAEKLLKNIDKVNLVACKTCTAINCKNRNGNQYYLPCWTNKQTIEVEIPKGYDYDHTIGMNLSTDKQLWIKTITFKKQLQTGKIDLYKETIPTNINLTYIDEDGNWKGYIKD